MTVILDTIIDLFTTYLPNPTEGHGWTPESGNMQPLWTDKVVLPQELEDTIQQADAVSDDENEEDDEEGAFYSESYDDDSEFDSDSD